MISISSLSQGNVASFLSDHVLLFSKLLFFFARFAKSIVFEIFLDNSKNFFYLFCWISHRNDIVDVRQCQYIYEIVSHSGFLRVTSIGDEVSASNLTAIFAWSYRFSIILIILQLTLLESSFSLNISWCTKKNVFFQSTKRAKTLASSTLRWIWIATLSMKIWSVQLLFFRKPTWNSGMGIVFSPSSAKCCLVSG